MPDVVGPAKAVGRQAVDVVIDYLVPIGAGIAGLVVGPTALGGAYSVAMALNTASNGQGPITQNSSRLGAVVFAVIWGTVGYAFWRLGKRDGWIEHLLGKGLGGFFMGTSLSYLLVYALPNKTLPSSGLVDGFFDWVQGLAKGG